MQTLTGVMHSALLYLEEMSLSRDRMPIMTLGVNLYNFHAATQGALNMDHVIYDNGVSYGYANHSAVSGYFLYDGGGMNIGSLFGWKFKGARGPIYIYNKTLSYEENRLHDCII